MKKTTDNKQATKKAVNKTVKTTKSHKPEIKMTDSSGSLGERLIAKMRRGVVKFTFINRLGKEITTAGTLLKAKIPTTRKVAGAQKPHDHDSVVFYDTKHGVRRQFNRNQVIAIIA